MTFHGHGFELVSGVAHTYLYLHTIEACMAMHTYMHQQLQLQLKTTSKTSSCKGEEKWKSKKHKMHYLQPSFHHVTDIKFLETSQDFVHIKFMKNTMVKVYNKVYLSQLTYYPKN